MLGLPKTGCRELLFWPECMPLIPSVTKDERGFFVLRGKCNYFKFDTHLILGGTNATNIAN
jgi:hypothetical protein